MRAVEEALIVADRERRRAQFLDIVAEHGAGLRRVARAYAARTNETEDLLQDIALALWRGLETFRGDCSARTFAFRIAHNRGITFAEQRRRTDLSPEVSDGDATVSDTPTPEEALGESRRHDALWRAIRTLSPGARAVLTLALEGMSHEQVGEIVGITPNAVAVRLSRARTDLKHALGKMT
jgi:RNA polymerase sigma-70 factor (ECF subfamily)